MKKPHLWLHETFVEHLDISHKKEKRKIRKEKRGRKGRERREERGGVNQALGRS